MGKVKVTNLQTLETQTYVAISPKEAVVSAYAQSKKDFNTWEYNKYYSEVSETKNTVTCGNFFAYTNEGLIKYIERRTDYELTKNEG
jgi:hypothetical protein